MTSISPDLCFTGQRYADKAACLGDLSGHAAAATGLDHTDVLAALQSRETLGSTGLGDGIALPHARLPSIAVPFVLLATLRKAIAFESVDRRPVDIVCLVLLPAHGAGGNLNVLSACARLLRDKAKADAIRRAQSSGALAAVVKNAWQS